MGNTIKSLIVFGMGFDYSRHSANQASTQARDEKFGEAGRTDLKIKGVAEISGVASIDPAVQNRFKEPVELKGGSNLQHSAHVQLGMGLAHTCCGKMMPPLRRGMAISLVGLVEFKTMSTSICILKYSKTAPTQVSLKSNGRLVKFASGRISSVPPER
jgi:hypothetical protein